VRWAARLALVAVLALAAEAFPVTSQEIEEALTCQCGCGLTVHSCNHLQCGSGIPLRLEVKGAVAEGLGRDEILVRFRDKYGEKILSAPVAEGFNRTAWIAPFALVGLGATLVVMVLTTWTAARVDDAAGNSAERSLSSNERQRLDEQLGRKET